MTVVSLHQPNFLPWIKLMAKIMASDVYVAYDSVQFTRTEYHNRQRLRARNGVVLLSVPVRRAKSRQQLCEVELDQLSDWRGFHLRVIQQEYARAPNFSEVFAVVRDVYERPHHMLVEFNLDLIDSLCRYLGHSTRIVRATDFPHDGDNTDRLIQLTVAAGGDTHLTSTWGTERRYIDWDRVAAAGLGIRDQRFTHPIYRQVFEPFQPDLAVLDLLFAQGRAAAGTILESTELVIPQVG